MGRFRFMPIVVEVTLGWLPECVVAGDELDIG